MQITQTVMRAMMEFPEHLTIQSHTIDILPRYVDTDQAGVVHHSVYPVWFELGRTELLRVNHVAYKDLEAAGVFFVVAQLNVKYRQAARYDEKLQLETNFSNITAGRVENSYKLIRPLDGVVLAEGTTILACISSEGKAQRVPKFMYPK